MNETYSKGIRSYDGEAHQNPRQWIACCHNRSLQP